MLIETDFKKIYIVYVENVYNEKEVVAIFKTKKKAKQYIKELYNRIGENVIIDFYTIEQNDEYFRQLLS